MAAVEDRVGKDVRNSIERILQENLGKHGYREATIVADEDHYGNPVLTITARFNLVPEPLDVGITVGIIGKLQEALLDIGEERFPHVRYDFHDEQEVATTKKRKRS